MDGDIRDRGKHNALDYRHRGIEIISSETICSMTFRLYGIIYHISICSFYKRKIRTQKLGKGSHRDLATKLDNRDRHCRISGCLRLGLSWFNW